MTNLPQPCFLKRLAHALNAHDGLRHDPVQLRKHRVAEAPASSSRGRLNPLKRTRKLAS